MLIYCPDDSGLAWGAGYLTDEGLVDLESIDGKFSEIAKAGTANWLRLDTSKAR